jgi:hypothetical protein
MTARLQRSKPHAVSEIPVVFLAMDICLLQGRWGCEPTCRLVNYSEGARASRQPWDALGLWAFFRPFPSNGAARRSFDKCLVVPVRSNDLFSLVNYSDWDALGNAVEVVGILSALPVKWCRTPLVRYVLGGAGQVK